MKRLALLLLFASLAAPCVQGADSVGLELLKKAVVAAQAGRYDEAIGLNEQVLTQAPELSARWPDAQIAIAQALAEKGDLAGAAQAAHVALDSALTPQGFAAVVTLTANILSALDKNVDRANQFLAFEQTGTGSNPMDAVGYPNLSEREKAFVTMRQQAGDDASASRFRAITFLFSGKPKDALAQFAEAFRRNEKFADLPNAGSDLVGIGLRAVRGHRVGLEKAMTFVINGPAGPDGRAGTPDDLPDPFASVLPAPPPVGEGGLAELPPDDLALLHRTRAAVELYAYDPLVPRDSRRPAAMALQRLISSLDGWGAPGQKDRYVHLALGLDGPAPDDFNLSYLVGAELAARGRVPNYGGVRALWAELDAICASKNLTPPGHLADLHSQFDKACTALGQISYPPLTNQPLASPATF